MLLLVTDCKPGKYPVVDCYFFFACYITDRQYLCETVRVLKKMVRACPDGSTSVTIFLKFIPEINIQIEIPGERFYIDNLMGKKFPSI